MRNKVLVVDDEPGIIEVIKDYIELSGIGLDVVSATSVDEALVLVEKESPRVIISDIAMPGKNGLDLLRELIAREIRTPVIIVSGYGDKDMIGKAWKLGAFDFMDKPINSKRMLENLKVALEASHDDYHEGAAPYPVKIMVDPPLYAKISTISARGNTSVEKWILDLIKKSVG